jgi:hypothetical protein
MTELLTIAEMSVTTPEIDVTTPESDVTTPENDVTIDENDVTLTDFEEPTPKKKLGRPAGSKSKIPGKPRAPRKVLVRAVDVAEDSDVHEEIPDTRQRPFLVSLAIPTLSHDQKTTIMLSMLEEQARRRATRKTDRWKSWFK